jgi:oxidase EvaA
MQTLIKPRSTPGANHDVKQLKRDLQQILHFERESPNVDFYISSLTDRNPFYSTEEIVLWLRELNYRDYFNVERVPLSELRKWRFDKDTQDLVHESGKFFSIRGLKVRTNIGPVKEWTQPIIHQPEIGVLGILTKRIDGILYFLMQAKAEPGNINSFQLSPTVQATRSNYTRVHGGRPTEYLEYFMGNGRHTVLVDQLQSEQGARFYHKRNRNIIVQVPDDEDIEVLPNFRWVTLGQLKQLLRLNNTVNMDARSVIASISFDPEHKTSREPVRESELLDCLESSPLVTSPIDPFSVKATVSAHANTSSQHSVDQLLLKIAQHKFDCMLETQLIPLKDVQGWEITDDAIFHEQQRYFSIIGVRIGCDNREVSSWDQPIMEQVTRGIIGFVTHDIEGVVHFLVQLKLESGNMDLLEMAPTVQCITDSYAEGSFPPFVSDILRAENGTVVYDTLQSEEGGRFFQEENRNMLVHYGQSAPVAEIPRYLNLNLHQLKLFAKFNNFLNVEARSLLSIV